MVDGLLRGDTKTRYDGYRIARETGWLSVNEIRSLENLNPVEGGDTYIQPLNMGTVTDEEPTPEDEGRDWATPLLEDAFFRAKRLQENGERQAKKRKGDHYGEWRAKWILEELPPLVEDIISPAIEAVYSAGNHGISDLDTYTEEVARRLIVSNKEPADFTRTIRGEFQL